MTITLTLHLKNDIIESKLQEEVRNGLLSKNISFEVIKAGVFNIYNHDKEVLACGYEGKRFKHKTNGIN